MKHGVNAGCAEFHYSGLRGYVIIRPESMDAAVGDMAENYFRQYGLIAIFGVIAFIVPTSMLLLS